MCIRVAITDDVCRPSYMSVHGTMGMSDSKRSLPPLGLMLELQKQYEFWSFVFSSLST